MPARALMGLLLMQLASLVVLLLSVLPIPPRLLLLDVLPHVLASGGSFLTKVHRCEEEVELFERLKTAFTERPRRVKPAASRKESAEMYILATGYRQQHPRG